MFLGTTALLWIIVFSYECTPVSNCSTMLFWRLYIERVGPSKRLLVQNQQQDTRKRIEFFFLTAIWLPHDQLWAILKETASLTRY